MKLLLTSTALVIGSVGLALAQTDAATSPFVESVDAAPLRSTDLMGARVYRSDGPVDPAAGVQDGWDDIGEISDVVMGPEGDVDALVADIGGFIGLGEKNVAFAVDQVAVIRSPEDGSVAVVTTAARDDLDAAPAFDLSASEMGDDFTSPDGEFDEGTDLEASPMPETTPVIDGDAEQARTAGTIEVDHEGSGMTTQSSVDLQTNRSGAPVTPMNDLSIDSTTTNVPNLDEGTVVDNPQTPATAVIEGGQVETDTASGEAGDTAPIDGDETAAIADDRVDPSGMAASDATVTVNTGPTPVAPVVEREGYVVLQHDEIVLPQIEGTDVYDASDELIGQIGYTVNAAASGTGGPLAILDVGGFLGLGGREVALPIDAMTFMRGDDGVRAYLDATVEQLEQMPDFEG